MTPTQIFGLQVLTSLLTYAMAARWLLSPWLAQRSLVDALTPLLLFHTLRTIGLVFLVPGIVGADLPRAFAEQGAYGDLLTVGLAWLGLVALRAGWPGARSVVWLFSVVGLLDFVNAFAQGLRSDLTAQYELGAAWFIPTFAVPAFAVTHVLVIQLLLSRRRVDESARHPAAGAARVEG